MKRVLITGANSYVGTNVEKWLLREPDKYHVETLDMKDPNWRDFDFSKFDVVFHVAGIAHVSTRKIHNDLYFKINRDLAIETAQKAKLDGVKQFIFMSSIIIYGKDNKIGDYRSIKINDYSPENSYGQSKLEADLAIQLIGEENFKTVILRSPVIYGPNSKGNFAKLQKIAARVPVFPNIDNQRSMIYIDNLCMFIKVAIEKLYTGIFYPQNLEYMKTKDIIKYFRLAMGKPYRETKIFNPLLKVAGIFFPIINRIFGNKTYKHSDSINNFSYISCEESLKRMASNN
ncbi:MAG: NAD-dependent epimerase/dehydratase family protein [Acholeplasmataceae bacterium]|nr:NAD-dependent epimerase/dehydratase family protein [Acholeplasmataceae bacterium]